VYNIQWQGILELIEGLKLMPSIEILNLKFIVDLELFLSPFLFDMGTVISCVYLRIDLNVLLVKHFLYVCVNQ